MRILRNSCLVILVFVLQACVSVETEVPTDKLAEAPDIMQLQGTVSNIREVKKDAEFSKRFGGSFIGALVHDHIFKLGDKVRFTLVSDHISAIVLDGDGIAQEEGQ